MHLLIILKVILLIFQTSNVIETQKKSNVNLELQLKGWYNHGPESLLMFH